MMEMKSTMESKKINLMGSEVEAGFECKPKELDAEKPIMHYKTLIYVCEDERCKKAGKSDKAKELREIVKELNLHTGKNRIKISRSLCQGACRFRQVMQVNENTRANGCEQNNGVWLKHTHKYKKDDYKKLFLKLSESESLEEFEQIDMKIYE